MLNTIMTYLDTTAAGDTPANASNPWLMPVLLVVMVVVFYFAMIRPQKKQEKQIAEMRDSLAVGDEVVTIGGIIGTVLIIKDDKIMIETGNDRTKLTILRSSVKTVLKDEDEAPAK
ncbi:MAG: preprotein translocase subunit YajC [Firmicutes bacterium]|uniref:Sec translocon accessory complex subunit YajC n=1 Tax=Candidatus Colimorpha enterica TaxID=3083063 RepID=A0AAE3FI12_9BACT|nr:preprotein translocase subunit YajC [Candidatus Colimorpha enterica]MDY2907193.1 preprotein translocase subunit YajC [Eubacteriales bacterium]